MKENATTLRVDYPEKLDQAPHVLAQLLNLLGGTGPLAVAQRQQIGQHLAICIPCQVGVEIALLAVIEDAQTREQPVQYAQKLLACLARITHATFKEEIPAYVEALLEQSEQEVHARFPLLTEHVNMCQDCQEEVRDLRSWLTQLA